MIDNLAPPAPDESAAAAKRRQLTDKTHEIYGLLRELRNAAGLSLTQAEEKFGMDSAVIGSYERGDRHPTVDKLDRLLGHYGYELAAIPRGSAVIPPAGVDAPPRVWTTPTLADTLRSISAHMDMVVAQRTQGGGGLR